MEEFIAEMSQGLTLATLWSQVRPVAPILITFLLFGLGYRVVTAVLNNARNVKKIGKQK